ncbi:MAG: universal stress protein [Betaproteobacteria bacterium]|nr:universal stress protein [Betaproteobacteria bacterium]
MDMQVENQHVLEAYGAGALKLLLPVDATARSRWGIQYAKTCQQGGRDVAVTLLFVAEPVTSWQVLRFRTQEEIRRFQSERANFLLADAAQALEQAGVPVQMQYREGDIAFHILMWPNSSNATKSSCRCRTRAGRG